MRNTKPSMAEQKKRAGTNRLVLTNMADPDTKVGLRCERHSEISLKIHSNPNNRVSIHLIGYLDGILNSKELIY